MKRLIMHFGSKGRDMIIELADQAPDLEMLRPRISVIGVGGAGGNAIANMVRCDVRGVEFIAANTDAQALRDCPADRIVQLGRRTTEGLGAGSRAETGRAAAEESLPDIERMLDGAHMCFIAAGMGGGTGTGAAPVNAKAARARGILTVGVVTRPFAFEGARRARAADAGLEALEAEVDTLIVIPNQNLFRIAGPEMTFKQAFDLADDVLQQGVRGITDLMVMPGLINLDFADIRTVMASMGRALMGTGEADGPDRAIRAAESAIANPLLDEAIKGARGLIISICGGEDMNLLAADEAASANKAEVAPDADIIWGSAFVPELEGRIRVSVVATGIGAATERPAALPEARMGAAGAPAELAEAQPALPLPEPRPVSEAAITLSVRSEPEQELVLVEPLIVLTPPEVEAEPVAAEAERGPSLFDRMAMAARAQAGLPDPPAEALAPLRRRRLHLGGYLR
jgi:cell division protein FtsZ